MLSVIYNKSSLKKQNENLSVERTVPSFFISVVRMQWCRTILFLVCYSCVIRMQWLPQSPTRSDFSSELFPDWFIYFWFCTNSFEIETNVDFPFGLLCLCRKTCRDGPHLMTIHSFSNHSNFNNAEWMVLAIGSQTYISHHPRRHVIMVQVIDA